MEDAFLIEEANRYDIKGKSYIGTPLKYYFMDMGLRNSRIHYRQMEVTHSMENVIYNELRMRGFHVDVGNLTVVEKGKDAKPIKKQLEVDFICSKGSKKYYIQSAYMLETEAKMTQEIRPFLKINDSFKKIVITSDTPKPFYRNLARKLHPTTVGCEMNCTGWLFASLFVFSSFNVLTFAFVSSLAFNVFLEVFILVF